jgi:ABC-2 type transport system ATP-binding protein
VPQEINFSQFERVKDIVMTQAGYYGMPRSLAAERCEKYLRKLDLWDKRNDRSRTLSGGMKRRLMIARALVHEPKLLILDEPTAGVDIELRRSMWEFLTELNESGTTIILTTHYLEEAEQLCRNIAIIDHGRIVENTSMRALLKALDKQTYIVELATPIESLPNWGDAPVSATLIDAHSFEITVAATLTMSGLFKLFLDRSIQVSALRSKSNPLEQLFLSRLDNARGESADV